MNAESPPVSAQCSVLSTQYLARESWRLILPETFDGPWNMAVDEAVLALVGEGVSPPTLRFYEWRSPWISLGTGQSATDLDVAAIAERGWGILRRSSGGTAVLHQGQVGYAVILPSQHPLWQGDLASSYRRLAEPLARGFTHLGAQVQAAPGSLKTTFSAGAPGVAARVCFSALGPYEILDARGRKVIGNSQVRRRGASLQHGTIQISGSQSEIVDVLANVTCDERRDLISYLSSHVGSLEESSNRRICPHDIVDALVVAFEEALGVTLAVGSLTDVERARADELVKSKFGDVDWTFRR